MGNCDIPDLDLFPEHYHIKNINFSAGMQSSILHFGIYACSWLIRICPAINLGKFAKPLLKFSHLFDCCGNYDGGMHIILSGQDKQGKRLEYSWYIIAKQGDGINIPTILAVYIAKTDQQWMSICSWCLSVPRNYSAQRLPTGAKRI